MTREQLVKLLQDADDLLRRAIQAQRGIGLDAGNPPATLRADSQEQIRRVLDLLDSVPRKRRG